MGNTSLISGRFSQTGHDNNDQWSLYPNIGNDNPYIGSGPTNSAWETPSGTSDTLANLRVELDAAVGDTEIVTLWVNGAATSLSVTLSGTAQTAQDLTHTVHVSRGDRLTWVIYSSSDNTFTNGTLCCDFISDNMCESQAGGCQTHQTALPTTGTRWYSFGSCLWGPNSGTRSAFTVMPLYGTVKNFQILLSAAPGGTKSRTFTVYKNGVATAVSVTITGSATTGSDLVNTVSVVPGDDLSIQCTVSSTPTSCKISQGACFVASTCGEFPICSINISTFSATGFLPFFTTDL